MSDEKDGLVRVEVWAHPECVEIVKRFAKNLRPAPAVKDGWQRLHTGFGYIDIPLTPDSP
jgi:hypothetical protein